ncbi:MAG: hypothetical protein HRS57_00385 [Mycoplasmataceae bacterium]|nr:hypothetical protein [Mycoplasmataceae bacterium]
MKQSKFFRIFEILILAIVSISLIVLLIDDGGEFDAWWLIWGVVGILIGIDVIIRTVGLFFNKDKKEKKSKKKKLKKIRKKVGNGESGLISENQKLREEMFGLKQELDMSRSNYNNQYNNNMPNNQFYQQNGSFQQHHTSTFDEQKEK